MTQPPTSKKAEPQRDRVHAWSVVATLAASVVLVAVFLPWVSIDPSMGEEARKRFLSRLTDDVQDSVEAEEDWRRLADIIAEQGHVSGLDVFYWARTAYRHRTAVARASRPSEGDEDRAVLTRAFLALAVALAALPVAALLVLIHFLVHRLRQGRTPILILAVLTGVGAILVKGAYEKLRDVLPSGTDAAVGLTLLLLGGALLFLAGIFGVRVRNWWGVVGGALLAAGLIVLLVWTYVAQGGLS